MVYFCKSGDCVSQTANGKNLYFILYFVFEWPVPVYIFGHWSNIVCLPAGSINRQRHLVEAENTISNCENSNLVELPHPLMTSQLKSPLTP